MTTQTAPDMRSRSVCLRRRYSLARWWHGRQRPVTCPLEIPAAELAVAVHRGSHADLDQTYGALGTYVAEREIGVDGPIREHYLVTEFDTDDESSYVTEVCWPVFQTVPSS